MTSLVQADDAQRQRHIPHLYVRGTNYEVGLSIGKTFRGLIEDFFEEYDGFKTEVLPAYESENGRKIYDDCLALSAKRFPQYVQELEGVAAGSKVPFHHIFLLHIEDLICPFDPEDIDVVNGNVKASDLGCKGCTSVIFTSRPHNVLLGHTEDALRQITNNFYIISAEILSDDGGGSIVEKFTSLVYPGQLPGGTMGYNDHGIIHSMNSIFPKNTFPKRTPHLFLTRAALAAKNMNEILEILRDNGCGTANGFSLNFMVVDDKVLGASERAFNVEVSPSQNEKAESEISVAEILAEECYSHCNSYLRCTHPEKSWFVSSSVVRQEIIQKYGPPYDLEKMKEILSAEVPEGEDKVKYSIFKRALDPEDHYATVVAGIFNVSKKQWSLYKHSPGSSEPTAIIPIHFNRSF